jgi:alcohol dehydrogenase class IV
MAIPFSDMPFHGAYKPGTFHPIAHGVANALMIEEMLLFHASAAEQHSDLVQRRFFMSRQQFSILKERRCTNLTPRSNT